MSRQLHFLLSNDDGISAEGLRHLASAAARHGKVTIVAPASQCSAMSQRITIREQMALARVSYPVEGVEAWSLTGTPADCIKVGLKYVCRERPDFVFSGLNHGWNSGFDTCYSGTVAAALEGLMAGVPSAAFSTEFPCCFDLTDAKIHQVIEMILSEQPVRNEIWNVNFPSCPPERCAGILTGVSPAPKQVFADMIEAEICEDGSILVTETGDMENPDNFPEGSDVYALLRGYVTIGKLKSPVL